MIFDFTQSDKTIVDFKHYHEHRLEIVSYLKIKRKESNKRVLFYFHFLINKKKVNFRLFREAQPTLP